MYFVALAADYDGTIAEDGVVSEATVEALRRIKASGRKTLLVTGRELPDLQRTFPALDVFDLIVVENGALLYDPAKKEEEPVAKAPPPEFVAMLQERGVGPISVGRSIVATWEPHEAVVLTAIRDLGLDLQIIFNKGAVMVLPAGVNKASGLVEALARLGLSPHNVVGVGDAENDLSFLEICGCAVAVDNAIPSVKELADIAVPARGSGVIELAAHLVDHDLRLPGLSIPRISPRIGSRANGMPVMLTPFETMLVTGSSGAGKSTTVTGILEQIRDLAFQFCVIDPEGDYGAFEGAAIVGGAKQKPSVAEVMSLLEKPEVSVVVNLLAVEPADRPEFLRKLLPEITKLRAVTGRPHWVVIDELHHCIPANLAAAPLNLPQAMPAVIGVTVHPGSVAPSFLKLVSRVIGVGEGSLEAIDEFCAATGRHNASGQPPKLKGDQVYMLADDGTMEVVTAVRPEERKERHARKYAEGELSEDQSFYFRGPHNSLKLRAQNLAMFLQLGEGVDEETWLHHLRAGDYSRWFRDAIKDDELAAEALVIEEAGGNATTSRAQIKDLVEKRYTAPARV